MDLIAEASATKQAMDEAYDGIEQAIESAPPNPAPTQPAPQEDFFFWGDNSPAPAPTDSSADQFSAVTDQQQRTMEPATEEPVAVQPPAPVQTSQPAPQIPQQATHQFQAQPPLDRQMQPQGQQYASQPQAFAFQGQGPTNGEGHNRNISGSGFGEVMGGTPDRNSVAESLDASLPHTPSMKTVEDLKSKCREAEDVSRDAEETKRQLQAQMEELRRVADEAESKARALAEKPTKKKLLGRRKVDPKEVEKLAAEARAKKEAFLQVQSQVNDAVALAASTKKEAERLRKEADDAQIQAATAASMQTNQTPAPAPVQQQPQQQQPNYSYPPTNGYPPPATSFQQQHSQGPPHQINTNPAYYNSNVMGNGAGVAIPTPIDDPFSNPFQ